MQRYLGPLSWSKFNDREILGEISVGRVFRVM
jgi:hypothetical protein